MTIDTAVLSETYLTLKQYIPQKDRQEAADNLTSQLIDLLSDHDIKEFSETDAYTERAYQEYAGTNEDEDDFDYDELTSDDEW